MSYESLLVEVTDPSQVGEARRQASQLSRMVGLSEEDAGTVALLATELATNLAKHATAGRLLLRPLEEDGGKGVELLSVDKGPGIANIAQALRDGYSSTGTRGQGLGAVARQSTEFDISSTSGKGTVVFSRVWADRKAPETGFLLGVVCLRLKGEAACGDGWSCHKRNGRAAVMVVDGLGHGRLAADAAVEAIRVFEKQAAASPEVVVQELHGALRKTRGAAASVAEVTPQTHSVHFAGIGNVSGVIYSAGKRQNLVSQNGTLGAEIRRVTPFDYELPEDAFLILHSDGIATHWDLTGYPGLSLRHPAIVAAVLQRDFSRARDDSTVLVLSTKAASP